MNLLAVLQLVESSGGQAPSVDLQAVKQPIGQRPEAPALPTNQQLNLPATTQLLQRAVARPPPTDLQAANRPQAQLLED